MGPQASPFAGVQFIPGMGYVQTGLGDEAAVMMISGLGQAGKMKTNPEVVGGDDQGQCFNAAGKVVPCEVPDGGAGPANFLTKKVKLIGIQLPLWVWLLLAAGVVTAGWLFLRRR